MPPTKEGLLDLKAMALDVLLLDLKRRDYLETLELQRSLVEKRIEKEIPDVLVLVEHPSVITLGRRGGREDVLADDPSIPIYRVERGGQATYHGPGQLVGYPILSLEERGLAVKRYVEKLEEVLIRAVADFGIEAGRLMGNPGVWKGGRKLASIGIAIQRWVAFHGLSLNINPDLSYFMLIKPCGLGGSAVTSMRELLGREVDMEAVKGRVKARFEEVFDVKLAVGPSWESLAIP